MYRRITFLVSVLEVPGRVTLADQWFWGGRSDLQGSGPALGGWLR